MIMTTQTIIGTLSMLKQRIPSASDTINEAIQLIRSNQLFAAMGYVDSLILQEMAESTKENVLLIQKAIMALWSES